MSGVFQFFTGGSVPQQLLMLVGRNHAHAGSETRSVADFFVYPGSITQGMTEGFKRVPSCDAGEFTLSRPQLDSLLRLFFPAFT